MYKEGLCKHVSNIHNDCTICNSQFNDLKSLNSHFFVKHNLEIFKCKVCVNHFKTEDILASHGTKIQKKCHICG